MADPNWTQGGQGALGGAMTGASMGSMAGPWGAGIGGAVGLVGGGLAGLFGGGGSQSYEQKLKALYDKYSNMQAPQAGPAAQGQVSQFRQNQAGLIAQLEAQARGEGPSAAAMQMREAMDRSAGAQASAAAGAGGRGVNAGAAYRNASNNTAAFNAQAARDTSTLRAQEQLSSVQQLGQVLAQGRAGDESMSQFNAGQSNQMEQANLEAKLRAMGITTQAQLQSLLGAMGAAGPGLGTQLMAGGASALPMLLQRGSAPAAAAPQYPSPGPITQPGTSGVFGQYERPVGE